MVTTIDYECKYQTYSPTVSTYKIWGKYAFMSHCISFFFCKISFIFFSVELNWDICNKHKSQVPQWVESVVCLWVFNKHPRKKNKTCLICSICWFPCCKCAHHDEFQTSNVKSLKMRREVYNPNMARAASAHSWAKPTERWGATERWGGPVSFALDPFSTVPYSSTKAELYESQ